MPHTLTWRVSGMHCASCEQTIATTLRNLPGVVHAEASVAKHRASITLAEHASDPDPTSAFKSLESLGYYFEREGDEKPEGCELPRRAPLSRRILRAAIAVGLAAIAGYAILLPLRRVMPSVAATASFGAMFGLGIIASLSTCLASVGGFILAYTSKSPSRLKNVGVHAGRLLGFAAGGAALGAIGESLPSISGSAYGLLAFALGITFLLIGLNFLNLTPSLASLGLRIPGRLSRMAEKAAASEHRFAPFLAGAATFFLPCGFTQTAQAIALASGSPIRGGIVMLAFALGTFPILAGISSFGGASTLKHPNIRLAVGAILLLFALGQIDGGLTMVGSPVSLRSVAAHVLTPSEQKTMPASSKETIQTVRMTVTPYGYEPSSIPIKAGVPVRWEIDGKKIDGCTSSITIPSMGIRQDLHKGSNILAFTPPDRPGSLPFSCGMGMVRGTFIIQ